MKRRVVRALTTLCALGAAVACDPRACLAYSPVFAGFRPDLVNQCCTCLAANGTRHPGAACAETFIDADGGLAILEDAGPPPRGRGVSFIPATAPDLGDDSDGSIESDEVPCLCEDDLEQCQAALTHGVEIVVTGACVSHGGGLFENAPCESACKDVINFAPLQTGP